MPNAGLSLVSSGFPSLPTMLAWVESPPKSITAPAAAATPGSERICRSVASDTTAFPPVE